LDAVDEAGGSGFIGVAAVLAGGGMPAVADAGGGMPAVADAAGIAGSVAMPAVADAAGAAAVAELGVVASGSLRLHADSSSALAMASASSNTLFDFIAITPCFGKNATAAKSVPPPLPACQGRPWPGARTVAPGR
jgi:hypothetical protein